MIRGKEKSVVLPVLLLKDTVLFPKVLRPLAAKRPESIAAVEAAITGESKEILVFTEKASVDQQTVEEELGEKDDEKAEIEELRERIGEANLPENVQSETEKELSRLERMGPASGDYQIVRSYIELILELPWHAATEDILDLDSARRVLDADHFNLEDVKDRIIEHLAVLKLNPRAKAPILCLVGPPGVGKTSLGHSIAKALGRRFERQRLFLSRDEQNL